MNLIDKHIRILFFITSLAIFSESPLQAATSVIVSNGFESGNLVGLRCSGNCPSITNSLAANGRFSANFNLTRSMQTNFRTEVVLGNQGKFDIGKEYWLEFNYRYEDWAKDSDSEIAPFQLHNTPSSWVTNCNLGPAVGSAPFLMISGGDQAQFITYGKKVLWQGAIQKNQWLNMSIHFRISTGSDGFVEAWKDGKYIGSFTGSNLPKLDGCGKPLRQPFIKMGIYKWNWQRSATQSSRRQLLIDDLKISVLN